MPTKRDLAVISRRPPDGRPALAPVAGASFPWLLRIRMNHILCAISTARHGVGVTSSFEGNERSGTYLFDNSCGDALHVAWSPAGCVALAFDHESGFSEFNTPADERDPRRLWVDAPRELASLFARVTAMSDGLGTAVRWMVGTRGAEVHGGHRESDLLRLFEAAQPPDFLLFTTRSDDHPLAERLARRSAVGSFSLREREQRNLLGPTTRAEREHARIAAGMLGQVGIAWR